MYTCMAQPLVYRIYLYLFMYIYAWHNRLALQTLSTGTSRQLNAGNEVTTIHSISCLVLSCLVLSCLVLSCLVLSCLVLSCLVLSCFCLVLSCFCLLLSCVCLVFVLSCLVFVLSCLVSSCLAFPVLSPDDHISTYLV